MTINSISTSGMASQMISGNSALETRLATLNQEISTGYVADTYSGLGTQARVSVNLRGETAKINAYSSVNSTLTTKLSSTASILTQITSSLTTLSDDVISARNDIPPVMTGVQSEAQSIISSMNDMLNTQINGSYLFSGTATGTAPMTDPTTALNTVAGLVSGYTDATAAAVTTNINSYVTTNTGDYYAGNSTQNSAQIDSSLTLSYGVTGNNTAFQQVYQALYTIANLSYDSSNVTGFDSILQGAQTSLTTGMTGINGLAASVGYQQNTLANTLTSQNDTVTVLATQLSTIEDANMGQVSTTLQTLQTQLEASYKVTANLSTMSLVNYIS